MNELALFAGAGGGILGGKLLGWRTVCAVEIDPYCRSVLLARQRDGMLAPFPIWDNVETFDGTPWRGHVDIISGGFPCQDISVAGRGEGIKGSRSGLWTEMARIIREVRPLYVFVENVPALTSRGLGRVLGDLAEMGFDARWGVLGAAEIGAPHRRDRIWIVAYTTCKLLDWAGGIRKAGRIEFADGSDVVPDADGTRQLQPQRVEQNQWRRSCNRGDEISHACSAGRKEQYPANIAEKQGQHTWSPVAGRYATWWATEPDVGRVAHGVANRVVRLRALGNGQVPAVAATAWKILMGLP